MPAWGPIYPSKGDLVKTPVRLIVVAAACAVGLSAHVSMPATPNGAISLPTFSLVGEAAAQSPERRSMRRTARRTARRTSERVAYRNSLPAGCVRRGAYWYCGGVYYQQSVQNGVTIYIVVNP